MKRYFTHYWKKETCDSARERLEGHELDHTAGNMFLQRGVAAGDTVFIVTIRRGVLIVISRFEVEKTMSQFEAEQFFAYKVWEANDHLLAADETSAVCDFDREVPPQVARELEFFSGKSTKGLCFVDETLLDSQALRGVRELTPDSAKMLEEAVLSGSN